MNAVSSRSHAVFMLTVVKRKPVGDGSDLHRVRIGKLFMVDLAGSERLKKSGSTGGSGCVRGNCCWVIVGPGKLGPAGAGSGTY